MIEHWNELVASGALVRTVTPGEKLWLYRSDSQNLIWPIKPSWGGYEQQLRVVTHAYPAPSDTRVADPLKPGSDYPVDKDTFVFGGQFFGRNNSETPQLYEAAAFGLDPSSTKPPSCVCVRDNKRDAVGEQRYFGDPM